MTEWRYAINYGPDGEMNWANVFDGDGKLVGNLRIHHAIAIVTACAAVPGLLGSLKDTLAATELYAGYVRNWVKAADLENHPYLPSLEDDIDRAKAAIAKAEGRS